MQPTNKPLACANGSDLEVKGIGRCVLNIEDKIRLSLKKCFFSPSLIGNFMSVSRLCDLDLDVIFTKHKCFITSAGKVVVEGTRVGRMYAVRAVITEVICAMLLTTPEKNKTPEMKLMSWHRALGHVNFRDLMRLKEALGLPSKVEHLQCESCETTKITRLPFGDSTTKTQQLLEIVPNPDGFRYFVTFTDDYTRFVHVYFMKTRDEVLRKFLKF